MPSCNFTGQTSSGPGRRQIATCLALSLFLHAAVFACLNASPAGSGRAPALEARILNVADRTPDAPEPPLSRQTSDSRPVAVPTITPELSSAPLEPPGARHGESSQAAKPAISVPEALKYYTAQEVDVRATPAELQIRPLSDKRLALGPLVTLKLRLYINETGSIDRLETIEADAPYAAAILDEFMREARFKPAKINSLPVKSQKLIEITFSP